MPLTVFYPCVAYETAHNRECGPLPKNGWKPATYSMHEDRKIIFHWSATLKYIQYKHTHTHTQRKQDVHWKMYMNYKNDQNAWCSKQAVSRNVEPIHEQTYCL
jgi:hypothetical protein